MASKSKKAKKVSAPKSAKSETKEKAKRRVPKRLCMTLYCYVEPTNSKYAREYGTKHFGSFSAYVDALIRADRKDSFLPVPVTTSELKENAGKKKPAPKKAPKKAPKPKKEKAPKAPAEPSAPETAPEAPVEPSAPETAPEAPVEPSAPETTQTEQAA